MNSAAQKKKEIMSAKFKDGKCVLIKSYNFNSRSISLTTKIII